MYMLFRIVFVGTGCLIAIGVILLFFAHWAYAYASKDEDDPFG